MKLTILQTEHVRNTCNRIPLYRGHQQILIPTEARIREERNPRLPGEEYANEIIGNSVMVEAVHMRSRGKSWRNWRIMGTDTIIDCEPGVTRFANGSKIVAALVVMAVMFLTFANAEDKPTTSALYDGKTSATTNDFFSGGTSTAVYALHFSTDKGTVIIYPDGHVDLGKNTPEAAALIFWEAVNKAFPEFLKKQAEAENKGAK